MENRMACRCKLDVPVTVFISRYQERLARLRDISVYGAFLECTIPVGEVSSRIVLGVTLPGDPGFRGYVSAYIVRHAPSGVGLVFAEDDETALELVAQLLELFMVSGTCAPEFGFPGRTDTDRTQAYSGQSGGTAAKTRWFDA